MSKRTAAQPQQLSNLYRFIRLIMGDVIPDHAIARKWNMDGKNFSDFKHNKYPAPRVDRLVTLAKILDVDDHLVYEVAKGTPAERVCHLIKNLRLKKVRRMSGQEIFQTRKYLAESEQRYQKLFTKAADAIIVADIKTGLIIDCNNKAERLLGRPRAEIIGMHHTRLHPAGQKKYYLGRFQRRAIHGKKLDLVPARIIRKNRQMIPVLITANVIELDGRPVIQGIFREIPAVKISRK